MDKEEIARLVRDLTNYHMHLEESKSSYVQFRNLANQYGAEASATFGQILRDMEVYGQSLEEQRIKVARTIEDLKKQMS